MQSGLFFYRTKLMIVALVNVKTPRHRDIQRSWLADDGERKKEKRELKMCIKIVECMQCSCSWPHLNFQQIQAMSLPATYFVEIISCVK